MFNSLGDFLGGLFFFGGVILLICCFVGVFGTPGLIIGLVIVALITIYTLIDIVT